jgi:hypothetical protein
MPAETTTGCPYTTVKMAQIQRLTTLSAAEDEGQQNTQPVLLGVQNGSTIWKAPWWLLTKPNS